MLLAQALFGNPDILLLDEPTNHLDLKSIQWLEDFLERFQNTVIVVSHDRHFLNQVCTHVSDIDFGKITTYVGNYDFWYEASQLALKQKQEENRKVTDKANELKEFIQRFSSNASKAKQATSRKKLLEKLTVEDMPVSSRRYPFVVFKPERTCGDVILEIKDLCKTVDGVKVLDNFSLTVNKGDKIALIGGDSLTKTTLFQILEGELQPDSGSFRWGVTITPPTSPSTTAATLKKLESGRLAAAVRPHRRGKFCPRFSGSDAVLRRRSQKDVDRPLRGGKSSLHAGQNDVDRSQCAGL